MGVALKDIPLTTRRAAGQVNVYPRLLRDGSMLPRLRLAIEYFESLLGHEHHELQSSLLVELFGDAKLARGVAEALAWSYRFRARRTADVVGRAAAARLERAGLSSPPGLRLWLYDQLNGAHHGFLASGARAAVWPQLETTLRLRAGQLEQLLYLDRAEHLRLERVGPVPRPADVAARYNLQTLECLLRHAERVELALAVPTSEQAAAAAVAVCRAHQVEAVFDPQPARLRLLGRQDALGGWARHGRQLTRGLLELLDWDRGLILDGEAHLTLRGRACRLRLGPDLLDLLGGPATLADGATPPLTRRSSRRLAPPDGCEPDELGPMLRACAPLLRTWGWRVRVQPWPSVSAEGVILPELLARPTPNGPSYLLVAVRGPRHARRLAHAARASITATGTAPTSAGPDRQHLPRDGNTATTAVTDLRQSRGGRAAARLAQAPVLFAEPQAVPAPAVPAHARLGQSPAIDADTGPVHIPSVRAAARAAPAGQVHPEANAEHLVFVGPEAALGDLRAAGAHVLAVAPAAGELAARTLLAKLLHAELAATPARAA